MEVLVFLLTILCSASFKRTFGHPVLVSWQQAESKCENGMFDENGGCLCATGYTGTTCSVLLGFEENMEVVIDSRFNGYGVGGSWPEPDRTFGKTTFNQFEIKLDAETYDDLKDDKHKLGQLMIIKGAEKKIVPDFDIDYAQTEDAKTEYGKNLNPASPTNVMQTPRDEDKTLDSNDDYYKNEKVDFVEDWVEYLHWSSYDPQRPTWRSATSQYVIAPFEKSILQRFPTLIENDVECVHGVIEQIFKHCNCDEGYTGQRCETGFISYFGSGSENSEREQQRPLKDDQCLHGIPVYISSCICMFGYTGVSCDTAEPTIPYSSGSGHLDESAKPTISYSSGSGHLDESGTDHFLQELHFSGSGSGNVGSEEVEKIQEFDLSGSGTSGSGEFRSVIKTPIKIERNSDEHIWHHNEMDALPWNRVRQFLVSQKDIAHSEHIFENTFVAVSTGIKGTNSNLHFLPYLGNTSNVYRFSFAPSQSGLKSRLELTTCYTTPKRATQLFGTTKLNPSVVSSLGIHCPIVRPAPGLTHTYSYEVFLPARDFPSAGKYIVTQWHGSADPNILRDEFGCLATLSHYDRAKLCKKNVCDQGSIYDKKGRYIGLQYVQGGYPPLTLEADNGEFLITARSDERVFIEKGGCGVKKNHARNFHCPLHPKQQYHTLARIPFRDFAFDRWVRFEWKIKWSEYGIDPRPKNPTDPGVLLSDAWIRLEVGGKTVVDWRGPCGRNDADRVPYFKTGVYNPSGSVHPLRLYMRGYRHTFAKSDNAQAEGSTLGGSFTDESEKMKFKQYQLSRNTLQEARGFRHVSGDGQCTLRANIDHVAELARTRFSRLQTDKHTLKLLKTLVLAVEAQDFKIRSLEKKLKDKDFCCQSCTKRGRQEADLCEKNAESAFGDNQSSSSGDND